MSTIRASKRQKIDRETTAAYAASQPLFDALRHGAERAGEQKMHLAKARDLVQNLHVKLADSNITDDTSKHDEYIAALTKAWASATDAYCSIFEELCKVTAPDITEGREATRGYEHFKTMAETAAAAKQAVRSFQADTKSRSTTPSRAVAGTKRALSSESKESVAGQVHDTAAGAEMQLNKRQRKRLKRAGPPLDTSDKPTEGAPSGDTDATKQADPASTQALAASGKENKVPGVEYEDVTAEVAARMKAKEDKKRAKKEQKKRKRESVNSELVEPAASAERPNKKKPKTNTELGAQPAPPSATKRKQDDGVVAPQSGAKKRKKAAEA
jgi:hypothetical protein